MITGVRHGRLACRPGDRSTIVESNVRPVGSYVSRFQPSATALATRARVLVFALHRLLRCRDARWRIHNPNYQIAARMVEVVSGMAFDALQGQRGRGPDGAAIVSPASITTMRTPSPVSGAYALGWTIGETASGSPMLTLDTTGADACLCWRRCWCAARFIEWSGSCLGGATWRGSRGRISIQPSWCCWCRKVSAASQYLRSSRQVGDRLGGSIPREILRLGLMRRRHDVSLFLLT